MLHLSKQHIKICIIITNKAEYNIGVSKINDSYITF